MVDGVASRLATVRDRIAAAAKRAGRQPTEIRLMAVTKNFPRETVMEALAAGVDLFGENRVQEAELKLAGFSPMPEIHLIGHLQRNKAKTAAGLFSCVQSIDKVETAYALNARCAESGRAMNILLELNTSGEGSKSGFHTRDELLLSMESIRKLPRLRVRGLMTVGPLDPAESGIRASFSSLRRLFDEIRVTESSNGFDVLSMGMSADFEIAIEEGSTLVRVGSALFGVRRYV